MAGLLDYLLRAAPGAASVDPLEGSVMSPNYVPQSSGRNLAAGGIRGLLDASPVGLMDAAQAGLNRLPTMGGAFVRATMGRQPGVGDAGMQAAGLLGSGDGYEAARMAAASAVPMMGLLGNQSRGALPAGYARDQSGAIVYHGSPHKFDKFDAAHIGKGEGAQAYGHGLYFAESKDVAKSYQTAGLQASTLGMQAKIGDDFLSAVARRADDAAGWGNGISAYADMYQNAISAGKTSAQALRSVNAAINKQAASPVPHSANVAAAARDFFKSNVITTPQKNLYKVDLPDDAIAKMLDWDKPWSQQPESVRKAIDASALEKFYNTKDLNTSQVLYHAARTQSPEQIAKYLQSKGIPGIRYLDGGSRTAGGGTSNYVVFPGEEGLLKILGRE